MDRALIQSGKLIVCLVIFLFCLQSYPQEKKESNSKKIAWIDSVNQAGRAFMYSKDPAIPQNAVKALELSKKIKYLKGEADASFIIASCYYGDNDYLQALKYFYDCIDFAKAMSDVDTEIDILCKISGLFYSIKDVQKSLSFINEASLLAIKTKNEINLGKTDLAFAIYYYQTNDNPKSIAFCKIAINYFQRAKKTDMESYSYKQLGDSYINLKSYQQSIDAYHKSIDGFQKIGDLYELGNLYTRISHVYQLQNQYTLSQQYNLKALYVRKLTKVNEQIANSFVNIGSLYAEMNKKDSAVFYLLKGINLASQENKVRILENAYFHLYKIYDQAGENKLSYTYYKRYAEMRQKAMFEREKLDLEILVANRTIKEAETKNELLRKENDLQKLELKYKTAQTILFMGLFLIALVVMIIAYLFYLNVNKSRKELQALNRKLNQEIAERQETELKLKRSEGMYRFLAENSLDMITRIDKNNKRVYVSPSCREILGYEPEEIISFQDPFITIDPEYREPVIKVFEAMLRFHEPYKFTYKAVRKDGSVFWAESLVNPIFDHSGELREMLAVTRDVSERMDHEEALVETARQKEILLREIHHRVKNNFAILVNLMHMQKSQYKDSVFQHSLSDLQMRVRTMSLVHEQLYRAKNLEYMPFGDYLVSLVNVISRAFNNKRITTMTETENCIISIDKALPLGLIVNELLTNTYKYAFPDDRAGKIWVSFKPVGEITDQDDSGQVTWALTIRDNGIGLPEQFSFENTLSMGTQIIKVLVDQLEATMRHFNNDGANFILEFAV